MAEPLRVFLVAGEMSGDQLGAGLMRAMRAQLGAAVTFEGVGGPAMEREGFASLFPMSDLAVMGIVAVVASLPRLVRRGYEVVAAVARSRPDILVIIDSPDFTHSVARRVARRLPALPIVNYVSPTVWAWRPGRARRMRAYIAHVLALQPFEPAVHERLAGPPCTYVGHPAIERLRDLRPAIGERPPIGEGPLRLLVLPGSRRGEIRRLMEPFGQTLPLVASRVGRPLEITLPAVPHLLDEIRDAAAGWPIPPRIVEGEAAKYEAFRTAHLALAASGTVTLELALSGVPMVVAYKFSRIDEVYTLLISVPSIVLANLVLGENVVPEHLQKGCTPDNLARDLLALASDTPERRRQLDAFAGLDAILEANVPMTPSARAARIVMEVAGRAPLRDA